MYTVIQCRYFVVILVSEGALEVGTVVWARSFKRLSMYCKGFISYKGTKLHVDLYDGDKVVYESKNAASMVIPDVPPKADEIKPGTRVIAKYKERSQYYSCTVTEVDASTSSEPSYHLKFVNGDETWRSLYFLRLLPTDGLTGGNLSTDFCHVLRSFAITTFLLVENLSSFS